MAIAYEELCGAAAEGESSRSWFLRLELIRSTPFKAFSTSTLTILSSWSSVQRARIFGAGPPAISCSQRLALWVIFDRDEWLCLKAVTIAVNMLKVGLYNRKQSPSAFGGSCNINPDNAGNPVRTNEGRASAPLEKCAVSPSGAARPRARGCGR